MFVKRFCLRTPPFSITQHYKIHILPLPYVHPRNAFSTTTQKKTNIHVWARRLNFKGKWKGIPSVSGLDHEWGMKKNVTRS